MQYIKIDFEIATSFGLYRDALYFLEEEVPPEIEIERMKQERVDNWVAVVIAFSAESVLPPVEEALQDGE